MLGLLSPSSGPRFLPQRGQQGLEGPKDNKLALMSLVGISGTTGTGTGPKVVRILVIYRWIEQICNILRIMKANSLTVSEGSYKYGKGKAKINPEMLDWNWRYW